MMKKKVAYSFVSFAFVLVLFWSSSQYFSNFISTAQANSSETSMTQISDPININQATLKELLTLKGIGTIKAKAIINYRTANGPFTSIEDLLKVKGFTIKLIEKIRPYITSN